jgi:polymorphic membrane protein
MPSLRSAAILVAAVAPVLAAPACAASTGAPDAISLAASTARQAAPPRAAQPARVVGGGTAASCTSRAVVRAVAKGGLITFNCGPAPVTITMQATARVDNRSSFVTLDGGGKVTLSGGGARRILYMDTCDQHQHWTTSHCQNQARPKLTVENLTFADGNSAGHLIDGGGGGAIFDRGGQLKVINSTFTGNRCDSKGPDLGGAAIRALSQYQGRAVQVTHSVFSGGRCSNGGALSSIGVSWVIRDSRFTGNRAIGHGANPARPGTPGGGSGGAIYTDGDTYTVTLIGSVISGNLAHEGGGAIFYVSNDRTGTLHITNSTLRHNPSQGFHTAGYPGIFYLGKGTHPIVTGSSLS